MARRPKEKAPPKGPKVLITVGKSRTTRVRIVTPSKPVFTKPQHDAHVDRRRLFLDSMTGRERRAYAAAIALAARERHTDGLMDQRLSAVGEKGKQAAARQERILDQLKISKEAGFDGSPPAFQMREFAVGKRKELVQYFNVSRDLMARLLENRVITPAQYKAARALASVVETFESVGLKAAGLHEAVDGGKHASVSEIALHAAAAHRDVASAMPRELFELAKLAAVQNVQIASIARSGRWGLSRNSVVKNLRKALDWLVDFYGIPTK